MGIALRNWFLIILISILSACADTPTYAPVVDIANIEPIISKYSVTPKKTYPHVMVKVTGWQSPVDLHLPHQYREINKGVDILGAQGEPIFAVQSGKVVYCGAGLRGYGNLIIIKHNTDYLSVYAHSVDLLVKQGDWVNAGQRIATMGNSGANRIKLYFEIRRLGKPLNPLILVPRKPV